MTATETVLDEVDSWRTRSRAWIASHRGRSRPGTRWSSPHTTGRASHRSATGCPCPASRSSRTPHATRSPGRRRDHFFELDLHTRLLRETTAGEGEVYHPGEITFDGQSVCVPTSQYRPNSRAIVYRLDPDAIEAPESIRFPDHFGALARDRLPGLPHAATWRSGQFLVLDTCRGFFTRPMPVTWCYAGRGFAG